MIAVPMGHQDSKATRFEDGRIILIRHEQNKGKGAAVRTGIASASGDITIIHDADLEYNPEIFHTVGTFCRRERGCRFSAHDISPQPIAGH